MMQMFTDHLHLPVTCIDRTEAMHNKLRGLTDPEAKRKAIGGEFIEVSVRFETSWVHHSPSLPAPSLPAVFCESSLMHVIVMKWSTQASNQCSVQ